MKKYICTTAYGYYNPDADTYTRYNEGEVITATIYNQLGAEKVHCFTRVLTEKQQAKLARNLDNLLAVIRG